MSDEELKDELQNMGEDPGPVNVLTRGVYERKLEKLRTVKKSKFMQATPIFAVLFKLLMSLDLPKYVAKYTAHSHSSSTTSSTTSSPSSQDSCHYSAKKKRVKVVDDSFIGEWSDEDDETDGTSASEV